MAITINLSSLGDGTYTVEDDGTPGNGTSVVRDPLGNIVTTFVHPADALTFISRTGQNVIFNVTDSLTTANVSIGSLTIPGDRPDSVQIGGVLTSGIVTLTANNTINEFGSDGATDIIAATLLLDAGTGIGVGNAIETQMSVLEAESVSGGINISNINDVTIGGATSNLRGLFTGTSGNIKLVNQGSITLDDTDGVEIVHSAGSLSLTAIGAAADIAAVANRDALFARGDMFLSAGRDVLFGRTGADFDNDVRAGGSIHITAGRDFIIDGFSDMAADDQGLGSNGSITISVGRDILIEDDNGVDASIGISATNSTGSIFLQTGVGGTFVLSANSSAAIQGRAGGVTIEADRVLIENDSGINVTGNGSVTLTTRSVGREIVLGSATDGVTALELSDAELDRINAAILNIGSANAGTIRVAGAINPAGAPILFLNSIFDILVDANVTVATSLSIAASNNILFGAVTLDVPILSISIDQIGGDGGAGGTVDLSLVTTTATSVTIAGSDDNDTVNGSKVADTILGGGGNDILQGGQGDDVIQGGAGNDTLIGGPGADQLTGGAGDDTYVVDSLSDTVTETAGNGNDLIFTSISYSLSASQDIETLSVQNQAGTAAIDLVGNQLNNTLYGNFGNNLLNGVGGADTMIGLYGDDIYSVDNAGDLVVELEGQGNDLVFTFVSYTLANGNEVETLSTVFHAGTTAVDLGGNDYANHLIGNYGDNYLNGGGGADMLTGFFGNDTYVVDNAGDVVEEAAGAGNDTVFSFASYALGAGQEVETLAAAVQSGTGALNLTGNAFAQTIFGNNGANVIDGKDGSDSLVGFGGADSFAFTTALGAGNVDSILDFSATDDTILLDDAVFTGLGLGALAAGAFVTGTAAGDADDRIIYNQATGQLFFDADGNGAGAAVQFATLTTLPTLSAADFVVI